MAAELPLPLPRIRNFDEPGFSFACFRYCHTLSAYGSPDKIFQREFRKVFYVYGGSGIPVINDRRYPIHYRERTGLTLTDALVKCRIEAACR